MPSFIEYVEIWVKDFIILVYTMPTWFIFLNNVVFNDPKKWTLNLGSII